MCCNHHHCHGCCCVPAASYYRCWRCGTYVWSGVWHSCTPPVIWTSPNVVVHKPTAVSIKQINQTVARLAG